MIESRPPTVKEAVDWLMMAKTKQYRHGQLLEYRSLYGDEFADSVEKQVRDKWAKVKK